MKTKSSNPRHGGENGSTILLALVVLGIGTMGVLAWAALIQARAVDADATQQALERRLRYENSRAMGEAYAAYHLATDGTRDAVGTELTGSWGKLTLSQWSGSPLSTTSSTTGTNHVSPVSLSSHITELDCLLSDGLSDHSVKYALRSESPMLSGDLLVVGQGMNDISISAPLEVHGRAVIFPGSSPNTYAGVRAERYYLPLGGSVAIPNLAGQGNLPDNLPRVPLTAGIISGTDPDYSGERSVIENAAFAHTYLDKVRASSYVEVDGTVPYGTAGDPVVSDGLGVVTVDLGSASLTHVIVSGGTRLVLQGQSDAAAAATAEGLAPVVVVVRDTALLSGGLALAGTHQGRGLILAVRQGGAVVPVTFAGAGATHWRMLLELEHTPVVFNLGATGGVELMGGISTDAGISSAGSGSISLVQESSADMRDYLANFASRIGWVDRRPLVYINPAPLANAEIGGWEGGGYAPVSDEAKAAEAATLNGAVNAVP